jgi:transcriptional regulator GlxA family with amidase domain
MDGKIFDLREHLLKYLDDDWNVRRMAEMAGLSVSHFPVRFKTETNMSPAAYLKEKRLERAKHLLETTYEHVKQIAIQVGMPNESHFVRDFKAKNGLTPTEYRRNFQEKRQAAIENEQKS